MITDVVSWLAEPLRYEFMRRGLLEVVIMGAVTGAVGAYVVVLTEACRPLVDRSPGCSGMLDLADVARKGFRFELDRL